MQLMSLQTHWAAGADSKKPSFQTNHLLLTFGLKYNFQRDTIHFKASISMVFLLMKENDWLVIKVCVINL